MLLTTASSTLALPIAELAWRSVNDTVMGGVSEGRVVPGQGMRFEGELSLEQNGGFASVRAALPPGSLAGARALRVTLRGDGRTWDLTLRRSDVPIRAGSYRAPVTASAETSTVEVPLAAMRPTSFGRPVLGAPALDTGLKQVEELGFLLADKVPGPFVLDVLDVLVVPADSIPSDDRAPALDALQDAIERGVPRFNDGDAAGCRDIYAATLSALAAHPALSPGERSLIREALDQATSQPAPDAAWTLRYAMDSVLRTP